METTMIDVFDPHFHIWDLNTIETGTELKPSAQFKTTTESAHDPAVLFAPNNEKKYGINQYEKEMDAAGTNFHHVGGVFVEAMSVCYPETNGTSLADAIVQESLWTTKELHTSNRKYAMMSSAALEDPNVDNVLKQLSQNPMCCGIRQIANFEPSHPRNKSDLLTDEKWLDGYKKLAKYGFLFEMQCNPHQLASVVSIIQKHPNIPVIINHLGCPKVPELEDPASVFWKGMQMLSQIPTCYLKISMLPAIDEDWSNNNVIIAAIHKLIGMFGTDKCFFASNFPVDNHIHSWNSSRLYASFKKIASRYQIDQQKKLFGGNAIRVYQLVIFGNIPWDRKYIPWDTKSIPWDTKIYSLDGKSIPLDGKNIPWDTRSIPWDIKIYPM